MTPSFVRTSLRALLLRAALLLALGTWHQAPLQAQDYKSISRSMELFNGAFRQINSQYIDETDPDQLVDAGIRAMLGKLDPYSVLLVGSESEAYDQLSSGSYIGFGYTVTRRGGRLVVSDVRKGLSAAIGGMRAGDRLVSVDGIRVDTLAVDTLRTVTLGDLGTKAEFRLLREGSPDTLRLILERRNIAVQNVGAVTMLGTDVGYVELQRFSRFAAPELADAIFTLQQQHELRGLVLDLRGNPGGLLDAAIGVANLFLPQGTLIVSTRDRDSQTRDFRASSPPVAANLPLVVLMDRYSASASEVLAGALQDNDRAVVLGQQSFGKGLVQSVLPLNDTVAVKITTARYYAPSGRCIQRRERRDPKQADTLMFATKAGRVVRSAQGIVPDSTITDSIYTPSVAYLVNQGAFADFAARQSAGMSAMPEAFRVTPRMVDDFIAYLAARPSSELNPALEQLDSAIIAAERQHLPAETIAALKSARAVVLRDMSALLRRESATLKVLIESELRTCLGSATDGTTTRLKLDPVVAAGQRMVASARYTAILRTESNGDQ